MHYLPPRAWAFKKTIYIYKRVTPKVVGFVLKCDVKLICDMHTVDWTSVCGSVPKVDFKKITAPNEWETLADIACALTTRTITATLTPIKLCMGNHSPRTPCPTSGIVTQPTNSITVAEQTAHLPLCFVDERVAIRHRQRVIYRSSTSCATGT